MDENLETVSRISKQELRPLQQRRDGPGLFLFGAQSIALIALSLATLHLAAAGDPLRFLAVVLTGLVLLTFFASMHEAGHGTAFATARFNRAATWVSAILMLQSPTFFREFHFEHHRRTSDPEGDPEVAGSGGLLGPWPTNPLLYLAQASGQHLMIGKALFTLSCALLPSRTLLAKLYPFIRPTLLRSVIWESRLVVVLVAAALGLGLRDVTGFSTLLLAYPVAHLALSLFVMAEHTGLPTQGSQAHRTRSTRSNAIVRGAMWNMSYHAEHHSFPAVPFHAAPELSRRMGAELEHHATGYLAFHREGLLRSIGKFGGEQPARKAPSPS